MCQFVRSHAGTGMTSDLKTYPTMNRFILYAGLLAAAVTAAGCRQAPTGNTDGDGTISPSFVQQYYDLSAIAVRQYFDYPYIQIMPETYETCSYSVPPSVRFKALSEKYGDTAYNRPLAPFSHTVYCNEFSGIDIFSDRDFDAAHPAGTSLSDIVRIVGASPYRYIRNGYTAPFDWRELPEDYRIENGISYLEGYLPVNGTLCELDAEEMYMLDPFELYLKFTILPEIQKHTVTVVLREQETEITGSTEIIFP